MQYGASNLEHRLWDKKNPKYKSAGEGKIAYFLNRNNIRYQYEPAVLVNTDHGKKRIWYPDFYLPDFGSYIEYYGLVGNRNYDRGVKVKEVVYSKAGLHVIPIYPWMLNDNWQRYIIKELRIHNFRQYRQLKSKRYWVYINPASSRYNLSRPAYHRKK